MTFKSFTTAACGAAAVLAFASTAMAQATATAPAAPAGAAVAQGPAIAGLCIFSSERAVGTSAVGKAVGARLQQIGAAVRSELTTEDTAITNEAKALEGQRSTLSQDAFEKRVSDLRLKQAALQRKAEQRQRELAATEQKALTRVGQEMDPVVKQVYAQKACSVLLDRGSVLLANNAMDITDAVVAGTNAKIQTFTFDRERLDQAAAPGAK